MKNTKPNFFGDTMTSKERMKGLKTSAPKKAVNAIKKALVKMKGKK